MDDDAIMRYKNQVRKQRVRLVVYAFKNGQISL